MRPCPKVDATLWRRRHLILFPWPTEPVELLAGCPQLPAPTYDLEALREDLVRRPAIPAEATSGPPTPEKRPHVQLEDGKLAHLALLGGLGLALALIILVLVRAVRRGPREE